MKYLYLSILIPAMLFSAASKNKNKGTADHSGYQHVWSDEIDILEHFGFNPGVIHASAHSSDYQWKIGTQKTGTIQVSNATNAFHSYILECQRK